MLLSSNESKHSTQNPLLRYALKQFFATINRLIPEVSIVLDAGCGEGYGAREMLKVHNNLRIIGTDLSLTALMQVPLIAPEMPVFLSDVTQLPVPTDSVELVVSFEVMEHLPHPELALEEYKRVSSRYIMISVPNEPLFRLLRMARGDNIAQWGNHPEHVNHWNLFSLQKYMQKHGLRVIKAASPPPFIWAIVLCEIAQSA